MREKERIDERVEKTERKREGSTVKERPREKERLVRD